MTQIAKVSITSDKDYLKIHDDGQVLISANGAPDSDSTYPNDAFAGTLAGSTTIAHPLGTIPMFRAFWDPNKNGQWWAAHAFPSSTLGLFPFQEVDPFLLALVSSTDLKLIMATNGAAKTDIPVFYRIYDLGSKAITSDSRIDKVFKKASSSISLGAAANSANPTFTVLPLPHSAGEVPLWRMQFSEDNSNWYEENTKIIGPPDTTTGPPGGPYSRYFYESAYSYADSTNFYIIFENNYLSSRTIYYRYALDYRA